MPKLWKVQLYHTMKLNLAYTLHLSKDGLILHDQLDGLAQISNNDICHLEDKMFFLIW